MVRGKMNADEKHKKKKEQTFWLPYRGLVFTVNFATKLHFLVSISDKHLALLFDSSGLLVVDRQ